MPLEAISLSAVLQFLICIGIVWLGRTSLKNSEALVRVETILTGATGRNGLVEDVAELRQRANIADAAIEVLKGKGILSDAEIARLKEEAKDHP